MTPKLGTITFATFHVRYSNFRHITFATLPFYYNFRHVTFATATFATTTFVSLYTYLLQISYVAKVVVAKVTWRKLFGESYAAKVAVAKVTWRKLLWRKL